MLKMSARDFQIFKRKEEAKDMHIIKKNRVIRPVERQKMRPWMMDLLDRNCVPGLCWQNKKDRIFRISWKHAAHTCFSQTKDTDLFERWALHTGRKYNDDDHKRWKANFRCALNSLPDVVELKDLGVKKGNNAFRVYKFLDESDPQVKMAKYNARKSVKALQKGIDLSKISVNQLKSEEEARSLLFQSPIPVTVMPAIKKRRPNSRSEVEAVEGLELLSQTAAMTCPLTPGTVEVRTVPSKKSPRSARSGTKSNTSQTVAIGTASSQSQPVTLTLTIQSQGSQTIDEKGTQTPEKITFSTVSGASDSPDIIVTGDGNFPGLQSSKVSLNLTKQEPQSARYLHIVDEAGDHISNLITDSQHVSPVKIEIQELDDGGTDISTLPTEVTTEVPYEKEEVVELLSASPESDDAKNLSYMYLCHWCQECFPSKVMLLSHFLMLHQEMLITSHASIETKTTSEITGSANKDATQAATEISKPSTFSETATSNSEEKNSLVLDLSASKKESEALDLRVVVKKNEGGEYLEPLRVDHESALDLSLKKTGKNAPKVVKSKAGKALQKKGSKKVIKKKKKARLKVKLNSNDLKRGTVKKKSAAKSSTKKNEDPIVRLPSPGAQQSGSDDDDNMWDHTYHRDGETNIEGNYTIMTVSAETKMELQKHLSNQQNADKNIKAKTTVYVPRKRTLVDAMMHCPVCENNYPKMIFIDHLVMHRELLPFRCAICHLAYSESKLLQLHIKNHQVVLKDVFECEYCWRLFPTDFQLMRHRKKHKDFICVVCQIEYDSLENLQKHQESFQSVEHIGYQYSQKKFKDCKYCQMSYDHHITHMKTHSRDDDFRIFECSICNQDFKYEAEISDHVNTHTCGVNIETLPQDMVDVGRIVRKSTTGVEIKEANSEVELRITGTDTGNVVEYHMTDISEQEVEISGSSDVVQKKITPNERSAENEVDRGSVVWKDSAKSLSHCPSFQESQIYGFLCDVCQKKFSNFNIMRLHRKGHGDTLKRSAAGFGIKPKAKRPKTLRIDKKNVLESKNVHDIVDCNVVSNTSELKRLLMHKPKPLRGTKEVHSDKSQTDSDTHSMIDSSGKPGNVGSNAINDVFKVVKLPIRTGEFSFEINVPLYKPTKTSDIPSVNLKKNIASEISNKVEDQSFESKEEKSEDKNVEQQEVRNEDEAMKNKERNERPTSKPLRNLFCKLCNLKFKYLGSLSSHMKVMHSDRTVFKCYVCGRVYLSKLELKHHMSCHEEKKYKCRLCGIAFSTISKLKKHTMSVRHGQRVACLFPSKPMKAKTSPSTGPPHCCTVCSASFQKVYELLRHNKVSHSQLGAQKRSYKFMNSLRKRTNEDTCMVCGQNFDYAGNLQLHMLEHVDEEIANMSDTGSDDLSTSSHDKRKRFFCSICLKELSSTNSLNRHQLIHTGVKPYRCSLCPYRCNQKGNLAIHLKTHHSKESTTGTNLHEVEGTDKTPHESTEK